ncbi:MAG: YabP/YqfC family sporulation protein [Bacilli bacterium]|nr:YabP/YqfC family sporulation protein [Bacilli bacterium]
MKNLQNFLLDQDYYIDIFNNCLHVYYYETLTTLTDKLIELKLKEFILTIEGKDLTVSAMDNHEILIKGEITTLRFNR